MPTHSLSLSRRPGGSFVEIPTHSSNSTLGFGRIYVVSQGGSPRRKRITQAANVTDLQLNFPEQPIWTEHDVELFKLAHGSSIPKGSLFAWLGHVHALRQ